MSPAPQNDTPDLKTLAAAAAVNQDASTTQQDVNREGHYGRFRTRRSSTPPPKGTDNTYGRYREFAIALRAAMNEAKVSASDLARIVWGSTTDKRGYSVARNRDRIGHYLSGTSYPEPENLQKIADALDVPVDDLASTRPPPVERPRRSLASNTVSTGELILTSLPAQPTKTRLQVDRVLHWEIAEQIHRILKKAEIKEPTEDREINPHVGEVVAGTDIENNGTK